MMKNSRSGFSLQAGDLIHRITYIVLRVTTKMIIIHGTDMYTDSLPIAQMQNLKHGFLEMNIKDGTCKPHCPAEKEKKICPLTRNRWLIIQKNTPESRIRIQTCLRMDECSHRSPLCRMFYSACSYPASAGETWK